MYELKKNGKVFTSKFVGTGPSSYVKKNLPGRGLTKVDKHCVTASCASVTSTRGILHCDINCAQVQNATVYPQVPRLSLYTVHYVTGRCHLQSSPLPSQ